MTVKTVEEVRLIDRDGVEWEILPLPEGGLRIRLAEYTAPWAGVIIAPVDDRSLLLEVRR